MTREPVAAIALDLGRQRIGVAGCDRLGLVTVELTTIERRGLAADLAQLAAIVRDRQVELLVIGLPYDGDGSIGSQGRSVQKLGRKIAKALALPIVWVDEQFTSAEAEAQLRREGLEPSRDRGRVDRRAAALILEQWLGDRASISR